MFTIFAQTFGILFVLSLLWLMVTECRACETSEQKWYAPKKIQFKKSDVIFDRIISSAAHRWFIKR